MEKQTGLTPASAKKNPEPSPIDAHVGRRIKLRRTLMGMSQERLGDALGVTFQQVQHYERGVNRVVASRLFRLSRVLEVSITFFFDDLPGPIANLCGSHHPTRAIGGSVEAQDASGAGAGVDRVMAHRETQDLIQAYHRIIDPAMRKCVFDLINAMSTAKQ